MANARQLARQCAVQALYSWQLTDGDPFDIDAAFRIENDMDGVDVDYFRELLREIPRLREELDGHIIPLLTRPLAEVDPVERAILRLGAYELKCRLDVPYRVAINEGVELAKRFGAEQGHRFVNGILDGMARELRGTELAADSRPIPEPAALADASVGKGKYGQKRVPIIRTASKKRVIKKRTIAKPEETQRRKPVADEPATKRDFAKKITAKKAVTKKKAEAKKTVAKKIAVKKTSVKKPSAKPSTKERIPVKKSGASLYAGKKKSAS
ncbi:MAG: transcription antitermination factor NusB [Gammaproteobacteria bacterium]|nr:transcription antitermination factor NusB [Gammaproteobacteria bacterium]MCF6361782.1 transcription antitermination factor NusB [Gammaproteobacteria bacterium]